MSRAIAPDSDIARVAAVLRLPGLRYRSFGNPPLRMSAVPPAAEATAPSETAPAGTAVFEAASPDAAPVEPPRPTATPAPVPREPVPLPRLLPRDPRSSPPAAGATPAASPPAGFGLLREAIGSRQEAAVPLLSAGVAYPLLAQAVAQLRGAPSSGRAEPPSAATPFESLRAALHRAPAAQGR